MNQALGNFSYILFLLGNMRIIGASGKHTEFFAKPPCAIARAVYTEGYKYIVIP